MACNGLTQCMLLIRLLPMLHRIETTEIIAYTCNAKSFVIAFLVFFFSFSFSRQFLKDLTKIVYAFFFYFTSDAYE